MAPLGLNDLSRAIGALEATVAGLKEMVGKEQDAASSHRQALRETIAALSQAVRDLSQKVADMHPVVEQTREQIAQARGRAKLGRILMALWMAISGALVALVTWGLGHWKGVLIPAAIVLVLATAALAHDEADWIRRGNFKNNVGALCCGANDCKVVNASYVTHPFPGFLVDGANEVVPEQEAQPSPDGQYWRCAWPTPADRKCFFAPPPTF